MLEKIFDTTVMLSTGGVIPTRWVGEQHVARGSRAHPSFADWVRVIRPEPWMGRATPLDVDEAASLETRRPGKAAETRLRTKV